MAAARALRLSDYGLSPGDVADLVLLDALVGQVAKRHVFKAGPPAGNQ
jgi:cytosine/adenosine deaminase-related metal-dependent hydrolase